MVPTTLALAVLLQGPAVPPPMRLRTADPREDAAAAFTAGESAFAHAEYEEAVAQFEQAFRLMPHPHTLYNLGVAQQLAGDLTAAWDSFRELEHRSDSAETRDDARARIGRIERKVAVLRVRAHPRERLCLDSQPIPARDDGLFEVAARGGDYEISIDGQRAAVRLTEGETRVLELSDAERLWGGNQTHAAVPALAGVTVGGAALAAVLGGVGLGLRDDAPGTSFGLTVGSATAAAVATATGISALVLHRRARASTPRRPGRDAAPDPCPPHPDLAAASKSGRRR